MADTRALSLLRTDALQRADMENTQFVGTTELNQLINYSYKELYDLLVDAVEDYNLTTLSFTITSGNTQALPSDHYKTRGIDDLTYAPYPRSVRKWNWNERNDYVNRGTLLEPYGFSDVTYRIVGSTLTFQPPDRALKTFNHYYVPLPADLVNDGDLATGINGWLEYVILDVAIKLKTKENSDTGALTGFKSAILARINGMKQSRDQGLPEKISRVRNRRRGSSLIANGGEFDLA